MSDPVIPIREDLFVVGGCPDECGVCLAIYGDDLVPEEVSAQLGVKPTRAHRKGETRWPSGLPAPSGAWLLEDRGEAPTSPNSLAHSLFLRLPSDPAIWVPLRARFSVQLRFGIHFSGWNKDFALSPGVVLQAAAIGAELNFDLYTYGENE